MENKGLVPPKTKNRSLHDAIAVDSVPFIFILVNSDITEALMSASWPSSCKEICMVSKNNPHTAYIQGVERCGVSPFSRLLSPCKWNIAVERVILSETVIGLETGIRT